VLVLAVRADLEWQHREGVGAFGDSRLWPGRRYLVDMALDLAAQPVNADGLGDIAEALLALVVERIGRGPPDLVEKRGADVDRARIGALLDARGEIDAVADQVVAIDHHVGQMQSEAHGQWFVVSTLPQRQHLANADRAAQCVDRARELGQHRVAHRLEEASVALGDPGIGERPPSR